jgi:hypothetical protein
VRRLIVLALVAAACSDDVQTDVCTVGTPVPDSVERLGCAHDLELLGYTDDPLSTFARTSTISVLIDRRDGDRVYFLNTSVWWLHFDFVYFVLEGHPASDRGTVAYSQAHAQFNVENYQLESRQYVLGKMVQYLDQGVVTYELAAGDRASPDLIVAAFDRVAASMTGGEALLFRPVSNDQEKLIPALEGRIPIIRSDVLFAGQVFQPLNTGVAYGYLRFRAAAQLGGDPVLPVDLVVLDRVPADISVVAGIITAEFQTPLSHINILAKNRGTPNMGLRGAFDDPTLRSYEGTLVKLTVGQKDWTIEPGDPAEAQAWWEERRPATPLVPAHDETVTTIVPIEQTGITAAATIGVDVVGAKAANFGELARINIPSDGTIIHIPLPGPAHAIPFAAFDRHMTDNGLWPMLEAIVVDQAAGLTGDALAERLFELRLAVYQAPLDAGLAAELAAMVDADYGDTEIRFRSSTNVEDLAEFSGAGLYTSAGASRADGEDALEDALKVVWASTWNPQAFVERDFYRVDQREVRMAVLVHPAFTDEAANGVAITMNEFASTLHPGFYINSQIGEVSVTNPTGVAIPEQILYYTWYDEPEYEVLTRSSLTGGAAVLTDEEYARLAFYLERIHAHFKPLYCQTGTTIDPDCAVDVEWKLTPARQVMIKQARPLRQGGAE